MRTAGCEKWLADPGIFKLDSSDPGRLGTWKRKQKSQKNGRNRLQTDVIASDTEKQLLRLGCQMERTLFDQLSLCCTPLNDQTNTISQIMARLTTSALISRTLQRLTSGYKQIVYREFRVLQPRHLVIQFANGIARYRCIARKSWPTKLVRSKTSDNPADFARCDERCLWLYFKSTLMKT